MKQVMENRSEAISPSTYDQGGYGRVGVSGTGLSGWVNEQALQIYRSRN